MALIHWWPLIDNFSDYGSRGSDLEVINTSAGWSASEFDGYRTSMTAKSIDYNGKAYIKKDNRQSYISKSGTTISFWYKLISPKSNLVSILNSFPELKLDLEHNYLKFKFKQKHNQRKTEQITENLITYPDVSLNLNEWYHFAIVFKPCYDENGKAKLTKVYVFLNGEVLTGNTSIIYLFNDPLKQARGTKPYFSTEYTSDIEMKDQPFFVLSSESRIQ